MLQASNENEMFPMKKGSTVALITPYTPEGNIDLNELRTLLQFHLRSGTSNLCILGTTGEASVMSMQERESVLKVAVDEVKGKMPILVGTGTIDPRKVKEMTQQAIDLGCDANLLVSPYYVKPPQRLLIKHITNIADMGLPLVIYNIPSRTGVDLTDANIALCAEHDNIVGVKDATGDLTRVKSLRSQLQQNKIQKQFLLYSGDDGSSLQFVNNGGDGCISVTANLAPSAMSQIMNLALDGKAHQAAHLNSALDLLHQNLFLEANPMPAKWAAQKMGLISTPYCRPPLGQMDETAFGDDLMEALRMAGLMDDDKSTTTTTTTSSSTTSSSSSS